MIVVGEALVDLVTESDGRLDPRMGGAARNLAIAAARLGAPVRYAAGLSTDRFGRALAAELEAEGVSLAHVVRTDAPTPLAVVHVDDDGTPSYSFHIEGSAAMAVTRGDLLALPTDEPLHVSLGAITLATPGVGDAVLTLLAARRDGDHGLTSLDPNVRPAFLGDPRVQRQRLDGAAAGCTLVRCSDEDLELLTSDDTPETPGSVVDGWLSAGAAAVVVTQGSGGAVVVTVDARHSVSAAEGPVLDTVGAGDTFGAALLVALQHQGARTRSDLIALDQPTWEGVLAFAGRAAAVTVSRRGADPPTLADLDGPA